MDSPNLSIAGNMIPNFDDSELHPLDGDLLVDAKNEAVPMLVDDTNANHDIGQLSNMQIKAKAAAAGEGEATLKSEHRHRFTLFPKLLFEIRAMIWDQTCIEPRIVEVEFQAYHKPESPSLPDFGFAPHGPVPALLHVCREARHQGLKHYTRVLQRSLNADHVPETFIYMSLENDILYVLPRRMQPMDREFYSALCQSVFKSAAKARKIKQLIRRLAIPMPPNDRFLNLPVVTMLKSLCGLKEVVFVSNWEVREESGTGESSNSQHRRYVDARRIVDLEVGADTEGEALIKVLKARLDHFAERYPVDPQTKARQPKFLFKRLA